MTGVLIILLVLFLALIGWMVSRFRNRSRDYVDNTGSDLVDAGGDYGGDWVGDCGGGDGGGDGGGGD